MASVEPHHYSISDFLTLPEVRPPPPSNFLAGG